MKAAHFLLMPKLAYSPPNEAIIQALLSLGLEVDVFAPAEDFDVSQYGDGVTANPAYYSYKWLAANMVSNRWRQYSVFSGTTEDPLCAVGVLSALYRKSSVTLSDEIRSGSYSGNRSRRWKQLCRWGMRRSDFQIVNDPVRLNLLKDYLSLESIDSIMVYPGCFRNPPPPADRQTMRQKWNIKNDNLAIADSGVFYHEHSALWLIEALVNRTDINLVIQPLNTDPLSRYLLTKIKGADRIYMEPQRIEWRDAWSQMGAADIGVSVYRQTGPQFQNMGISSNRLCMFLAMGVPVIVSKQPSFEFVEKYDCGVMVENEHEFFDAIDYIKPRLEQMKKNALTCTAEYINAGGAYDKLVEKFRNTLGL